jgi:hypothetical protein
LKMQPGRLRYIPSSASSVNPPHPAKQPPLGEEEKVQCQWWAPGLIGPRPIAQKKGAGRGIHGKILFRSDSKAAFAAFK